MTTTNVVQLEGFRELKEYKQYLATLGNSQLEAEINFLFEEFPSLALEKEVLGKGQMILKEIASRADGDWKKSIETLNQELHLI